jgi:hypothetical protein
MCFIPWQEPVKHSVPKLPIFYLGAKYFQTKVFSYSPQGIFNILFSIRQFLLLSGHLTDRLGGKKAWRPTHFS